VNWKHGSLVNPPAPDEPRLDEHTAALLDEAEDIINAAGPQILAEMAAKEDKPRWWDRWRRRRGLRPD
jgi:hypothetical protein